MEQTYATDWWNRRMEQIDETDVDMWNRQTEQTGETDWWNRQMELIDGTDRWNWLMEQADGTAWEQNYLYIVDIFRTTRVSA